MSAPQDVIVSGGFDDIRSHDLRLLEKASRLGELTVRLWPEAPSLHLASQAPRLSLAERRYMLNAVRYVNQVIDADGVTGCDALPDHLRADVWADCQATSNTARRRFAADRMIAYRVFTPDELQGFPEPPPMPSAPGRRKVVATGCYDWFHSGHVRFTEEASAYRDLYVCLGSDANVRLLKGPGHPLLTQEERRHVVGSIKYVKQALITTGSGWVDADPEIRRLKPAVYVVKDDGDKGGKREYCAETGMEYLVLKRTPAPGLPTRSSTDLRGFS